MKPTNAFVRCALLSLLVAAGACGDDDAPADVDSGPVDCSTIQAGQDVYEPGLEKIGANGYTVHLMSATPAPPAKGDNTWMIHVVDDTDNPGVGLTISATPWMPHHQHGTPIVAVVTEMGDPGMYQITPINLLMAGVWEITIAIGDGENDLDEVLYTFCVDG